MKTVNAVVKVLTALATVAGAVYIIATYGDKIVEWAKSVLNMLSKCEAAEEAPAEEAAVEEAPAEEVPVEEAAEEAPAEEAPAEEVPAEEGAPVADESDFEG